jgi:hypothetical protein
MALCHWERIHLSAALSPRSKLRGCEAKPAAWYPPGHGRCFLTLKPQSVQGPHGLGPHWDLVLVQHLLVKAQKEAMNSQRDSKKGQVPSHWTFKGKWQQNFENKKQSCWIILPSDGMGYTRKKEPWSPALHLFLAHKLLGRSFHPLRVPNPSRAR